MDEPTAGLDPNQIRQFRDNVQSLGRTKTLLISTHILHEAEATADRVVLVDSGRLVFDGSLEELQEDGSLERPFYRADWSWSWHTDGGACPGLTFESSGRSPSGISCSTSVIPPVICSSRYLSS